MSEESHPRLIEKLYRIIIEEMDEGAVSLSTEGIILYCNRRFAELVSMPMEQLVGSNFTSIVAESDKPKFDLLLQAGLKGKSLGEITKLIPGCNPRYFYLAFSPLLSDTLGAVCVLVTDITELKEKKEELRRARNGLEQRVLERTANLTKTVMELADSKTTALKIMDESVQAKKALEVIDKKLVKQVTMLKRAEEQVSQFLSEKELLLQEVHHRLKNNLLTIMSLLQLQTGTLKDAAAIKALEDARSRVQSMMVLYDKLYRSTEFGFLSIKEYLCPLVDQIINNFSNRGLIAVEKQIDDFILEIEQLYPVGIIINELLTNAMASAFIGRDSGLIQVSASIKDDSVTIVVKDNGQGLPESYEASKGFGLQLVDFYVKQLKGSLQIESKCGTKFSLEFNTQDLLKPESPL